MKVDDREILFIRQNSPVGFPRLIQEALEAKGIHMNRTLIHKEIRTLKDNHVDEIIITAREIIKAVKRVEYNPQAVA